MKKLVLSASFFVLSGLVAGEERIIDINDLGKELGEEPETNQIYVRPLNELEKLTGVDSVRLIQYLKKQGRFQYDESVEVSFRQKLEQLRKDDLQEYKQLANKIMDPEHQPAPTRSKKTPHELALERLLGMLQESTQESMKLNKEWMAAQGKAADRSFKTTLIGWVAAPLGSAVVTAVITGLVTYYATKPAHQC